MKSIMRLFICFVVALAIVSLMILSLNVILTLYWGSQYQYANHWRSDMAQMAQELNQKDDGRYLLSDQGLDLLENQYEWAMLLNEDGNIVWNWNLPEDVASSYTLQEVSQFSRWYLKDYPVYVWEHQDGGILVFGNAKESYWKYGLDFPVDVITQLPRWILKVIYINIVFALILSLLMGIWVFRALKPFAKGVLSLTEKKHIHLSTGGMMGDLAKSINKASAELSRQSEALEKRDVARANWIFGISHDIRTPLSMVVGYASELEEDSSLSSEVRGKAEIIRRQGLKIKQLVSDLNLASKLEYEMHPLKEETIYLAEMMRQIVADFINGGLKDSYSMNLVLEEDMEPHIIFGDTGLLKRAISNIIYNSITHNPLGCTIAIEVKVIQNEYYVNMSDNGVGVSEKKLDELRNSPHYMVSDEDQIDQRHGLGLIIVQQIVKVHQGRMELKSVENQGFSVEIRLPFIELIV